MQDIKDYKYRAAHQLGALFALQAAVAELIGGATPATRRALKSKLRMLSASYSDEAATRQNDEWRDLASGLFDVYEQLAARVEEEER